MTPYFAIVIGPHQRMTHFSWILPLDTILKNIIVVAVRIPVIAVSHWRVGWRWRRRRWWWMIWLHRVLRIDMHVVGVRGCRREKRHGAGAPPHFGVKSVACVAEIHKYV